MRDLRVCFAGDSYLAGVGDRSALGWVGRVAAYAAECGLPITAYNLGVRGETGPDVARRLPAELKPRLRGIAETRVVVSFGANDTVTHDGISRATPAQTVGALKDIHATTPVPMLVVGPPAVDTEIQNERIAATSEQLSNCAKSLEVPFIETFADTASSSLWRHQVRDGDGYHPDAEGYAFLADLIAPGLIEWLRSPKASTQ